MESVDVSATVVFVFVEPMLENAPFAFKMAEVADVPAFLASNPPVILGSPALFSVPAVEDPSTNLSIRSGSANVVLPSPDPYVVPTAENSVA